MQISVFESEQLRAVIVALKGMDRELQAQIRKATREVSIQDWRSQLAQQATTKLENRVLVDSARVTVSNNNVTLKAGQLSKRLAGGAKVYELTPGVEFGGTQRQISSRSSTGKAYTRRRGQQFRRRNRKGYVAYPAAAQVIPRIASLWVQTAVRTLYEAVER